MYSATPSGPKTEIPDKAWPDETRRCRTACRYRLVDGTYQKVIESGGFTSQALRRIDPNPRLAILIQYGVLTGEQQAVTALRTSFERTAAATE
jgi:hypothetical protein